MECGVWGSFVLRGRCCRVVLSSNWTRRLKAVGKFIFGARDGPAASPRLPAWGPTFSSQLLNAVGLPGDTRTRVRIPSVALWSLWLFSVPQPFRAVGRGPTFGCRFTRGLGGWGALLLCLAHRTRSEALHQGYRPPPLWYPGAVAADNQKAKPPQPGRGYNLVVALCEESVSRR